LAFAASHARTNRNETVFYLFILFLAAAGSVIYFYFFMHSVPGAREERFGELEPLPPDLGTWKEDVDSSEAAAAKAEGLKREARFFFEESKERLVKQVRYRSRDTNEIVRTEADEVVKRRRLRA
jgi:hypothetical protein